MIAQWISAEREPHFCWDDGMFCWEFTLTGPRLDFLFRARAVGKTYGEAYVWSLVQRNGVTMLLATTRHYDAHRTPLVRETVLRRITIEDERDESLIGRRHQLEVEATGPLLVTRFDAREVARFTDSSHRRGTIGVAVHRTDAAVVHRIRVTTDHGTALAVDFANNHNPMSGGTVAADGLVVAGNVRMGLCGRSIPESAPGMDIVFPLTAPAPLFRREFSVQRDVESARLHVAAGGLPRIEINGVQINEAIEDGFTDYDHRVLYRTHDVAAALSQGENAIGVELGRGWYDLVEPNEWYWHMAPWRAMPALLLQLEIVDIGGRRRMLVSDDRWCWTPGPTLHDSIYAGERYDARRAILGWSRPGFDAASWYPVALVDGPKGKLVPAEHEPIAVTRTIRPVSLREVQPDVWVYDFGEIFAGRVRLHVEGPAGRTVV